MRSLIKRQPKMKQFRLENWALKRNSRWAFRASKRFSSVRWKILGCRFTVRLTDSTPISRPLDKFRNQSGGIRCWTPADRRRWWLRGILLSLNPGQFTAVALFKAQWDHRRGAVSGRGNTTRSKIEVAPIEALRTRRAPLRVAILRATGERW